MEEQVKPVDHLPGVVRGENRRTDWAEVCRQVRDQRPNWCVVGVFNPSVATHIRQGKYPAVDPDKFEIATRKYESDGPKLSTLYMRYIVR